MSRLPFHGHDTLPPKDYSFIFDPTFIGTSNMTQPMYFFFLLVVSVSAILENHAVVSRQQSSIHRTILSASKDSTPSEEGSSSRLSVDSIYFDIEIQETSIGRLIFHLTNPSSLPLHAENVIQLAKGSRRGIDPRAHYVGCEFDYSPAAIEDGMGRYRWGHSLKGRGRNAIGRADQTIVDQANQLKNTRSCFGGQYYGDEYIPSQDDPGVLLTVPILGPGYGSSKFTIVRVGESPKEWQERLLINSGVIGRLDPSCLEVLHTMARQRVGPPKVVNAGAPETD
jgi:hypothetical protein